MSDPRLAEEGLAYCNRLFEAAEAAASVAGQVDLDVEIASLPLRLRFSGAHLARMLGEPLAHGQSPRSTPGLTLEVFDDAGNGSALPDPPWGWPPAGEGGQPLARYADDRVSILLESRERGVTAFDRVRGRAVIAVPDAAVTPVDERDTRLRYPLQMLLSAFARPMIHAAAVGERGRAALIPGWSGAGKSTLTVACALAGMEVCADDYVVIEPAAKRAHALLATTKLTEKSVRMLGLERGPSGARRTYTQWDSAGVKTLIDLREVAPKSFRPSMRISAVVVPKLVPTAVASRAISGGAALRALAPSTVMQQPARDAGLLPAMAAVVRDLPCFELDLSPDLAANVAALRNLVAETA